MICSNVPEMLVCEYKSSDSHREQPTFLSRRKCRPSLHVSYLQIRDISSQKNSSRRGFRRENGESSHYIKTRPLQLSNPRQGIPSCRRWKQYHKHSIERHGAQLHLSVGQRGSDRDARGPGREGSRGEFSFHGLRLDLSRGEPEHGGNSAAYDE